MIVDLTAFIRDVPDFPKPGIVFKDITPLLSDAGAIRSTIGQLAQPYRGGAVDQIIGIESRGFIFGAALALELGVGFVPIRKPGKLPSDRISAEYELEYGTNKIEIHTDAISEGQKVALVDDLLATGGTMAAACKLVSELKGEIVGISFLIELDFLEGRKRLEDLPVHTLINY
jgi:adenine phosphoribosyltransferase